LQVEFGALVNAVGTRELVECQLAPEEMFHTESVTITMRNLVIYDCGVWNCEQLIIILTLLGLGAMVVCLIYD
jgi:hypothetical protein